MTWGANYTVWYYSPWPVFQFTVHMPLRTLQKASYHISPWICTSLCYSLYMCYNFLNYQACVPTRNFVLYISTPSTRKGFHAESKASHGGKQHFFSDVPNALVFYYTWFRKPNSNVQRRSEQYLEVCFVLFLCPGGSMRGSQNLEIVVFSVKKNPTS